MFFFNLHIIVTWYGDLRLFFKTKGNISIIKLLCQLILLIYVFLIYSCYSLCFPSAIRRNETRRECRSLGSQCAQSVQNQTAFGSCNLNDILGETGLTHHQKQTGTSILNNILDLWTTTLFFH